MLGQVVMMVQNRGATFTEDGLTFALCNGQLLPRASYALLSSVWPENAFGSTANSIQLPDMTDMYLRGTDFGRGADPAVASRSAQAGSLPITSGVGSFQSFALSAHTHDLGTTGQGGSRAASGNDTCYVSNTGDNTQSMVITTAFVSAGTEFLPQSMKYYPYMQVTIGAA